jgi:hypothetical protein
MKKLLLLGSVILFSFTKSAQTSAYICVSPNAKKYHYSKTCRGIQKCTHTIKQVTVTEAKNLGYTVCLIEN